MIAKQEIIDAIDLKDGDRIWAFVERSEGEKTMMHRINIGYSALELLGLASLATVEIADTIRKSIKPDINKRTVIIEEPEEAKG